MGWFLDLQSQVRRVLLARHGGTGNDHSAAIYTVRRMAVRQTGAAVTKGMIVRCHEVDKADPVDDATVTDSVGIVLGKWLDDGRIDEAATAGQFDFVAVVVAGMAQVLLAEDVTGGEYCFPSDTTGAARGEADPDVGMVGRFVGMGSADGYALVKLGGGGASQPDPLASEVEFTFVTPTNGLESKPVRIPADCAVTGWTIVADATGSVQFDVWAAPFASFPPDVGDTITASAKPSLSSAQTGTSTSLSGWTTALSEGDQVVANVDTVSGLGWVILTLHVVRT